MTRWICSLFLAAAVWAQPAFDVASVKEGGPVRPDGLLNITLGKVSHGTVTLTNTTLSECIQYAYGLTNEVQIAGPDWIRSRQYRFQIVAKAPPDTPPGQLRLMMQALLEERFRLAVHREPRRIPHLDLTVAKGGPRMPVTADGPMEGRYYGPGRLSYGHMTMDWLVLMLSRQLKQPVFNRTGLNGAFDVELDWTPDNAEPDPNATPYPDLFSAIQKQLGLKLEESKSELEVLVVDHAEKTPLPN
ncbi:MAG TPA: TIGR03435 family protein [Bryobacteraceae bacterium]|nr:TIGR03435 family protein [Bryobacteraceae bacterium]